MAGVLCLFTAGLDRCCINAGSWSSAPEARAVGVGCLVPRRRKRKAPQGINLGEPKKYEAACACRSPVTQKSRSQARPPLDASWQQSGALASKDYSSQSDEKSNSEAWSGW